MYRYTLNVTLTQTLGTAVPTQQTRKYNRVSEVNRHAGAIQIHLLLLFSANTLIPKGA